MCLFIFKCQKYNSTTFMKQYSIYIYIFIQYIYNIYCIYIYVMYIYICIYICIYIYMCMYIYNMNNMTKIFFISQANTHLAALDLSDNALGNEGVRHICTMLLENIFITDIVSEIFSAFHALLVFLFMFPVQLEYKFS